MKPAKNAPLDKVRQIITTDAVIVANTLLQDSNWILVNTYKKYRGQFYYVLGRVGELKDRVILRKMEKTRDKRFLK